MIEPTRIEIYSKNQNSQWDLAQSVKRFMKIPVKDICKAKVYWIHSPLKKIEEKQIIFYANEVLCDPIIEKFQLESWNSHFKGNPQFIVEKSFKPGVTDNAGMATLEAIQMVDPSTELINLNVHTGELFGIYGELKPKQIQNLAEELLGNSLIHKFKIYTWSEFKHRQRFKKNIKYGK